MLAPINFSELNRDVAGMILGVRETAVMVSYIDLQGLEDELYGPCYRTFLVPLKEIANDSSLYAVLAWDKNEATIAYEYDVVDPEKDHTPAKRILEGLIKEMGGKFFNMLGNDYSAPAWNLVKYELTNKLVAFDRLVPTRWVTIFHNWSVRAYES